MSDHSRIWSGHRIILPEVREKTSRCCADCRFFVEILGREESLFGCVQGIDEYRKLHKRVPEKIHLIEILRTRGSKGLQEILNKVCSAESHACGMFLPKLRRKKIKNHI